jgi:hypothetical protein
LLERIDFSRFQLKSEDFRLAISPPEIRWIRPEALKGLIIQVIRRFQVKRADLQRHEVRFDLEIRRHQRGKHDYTIC